MIKIPSNKALILSVLAFILIVGVLSGSFYSLTNTLDPVRRAQGQQVEALIESTRERYDAETAYLKQVWTTQDTDLKDKLKNTIQRRAILTISLAVLALPFVGGGGFALSVGLLSVGLVLFAWALEKWRRFMAPIVIEVPGSDWYLVGTRGGVWYEKNKKSGASRPALAEAKGSKELLAAYNSDHMIEAIRDAHKSDPRRWTPLLVELFSFLKQPTRAHIRREVFQEIGHGEEKE